MTKDPDDTAAKDAAAQAVKTRQAQTLKVAALGVTIVALIAIISKFVVPSRGPIPVAVEDCQRRIFTTEGEDGVDRTISVQMCAEEEG